WLLWHLMSSLLRARWGGLTVVLVLMGSSFLSEVHYASDQEGAPRPRYQLSFAPTAAPGNSSAQRLSRQRFRALAQSRELAGAARLVRSWGLTGSEGVELTGLVVRPPKGVHGGESLFYWHHGFRVGLP